LVATYKRTDDAGDIKYSQNGDSSNEVAILLIPLNGE
jgi:hypothetical protein